MISSELTLASNSLCSSSDTLNSFLSSVIKLSLSCRTESINLGESILKVKQILQGTFCSKTWKRRTHPSNGICLGFKCTQYWAVSFLLEMMNLGLHIVYSRVWERTQNRHPLSGIVTSSRNSVTMWWWKIIISTCSYFIYRIHDFKGCYTYNN